MAFTRRRTGILRNGSHGLQRTGWSPNQELEESFETLEAMAGEISDSVFVVKQIDVLPLLSGLGAEPARALGGRGGTCLVLCMS